MAESGWIELDTRALAESGARSREQGGVKIAESLSPYDIPVAVRSYQDEKSGRYVIEFRYIQDEAWNPKLETPDSPITLRVGKNSDRLYGIEFDIPKLSLSKNVHISQDVLTLMSAAFERLLERPRPGREGHYKVLQQAVNESETQLLEKLDTNERSIATG